MKPHKQYLLGFPQIQDITVNKHCKYLKREESKWTFSTYFIRHPLCVSIHLFISRMFPRMINQHNFSKMYFFDLL